MATPLQVYLSVCAARCTAIVLPRPFCLSSLKSCPSKQSHAPLRYWFRPRFPSILAMANCVQSCMKDVWSGTPDNMTKVSKYSPFLSFSFRSVWGWQFSAARRLGITLIIHHWIEISLKFINCLSLNFKVYLLYLQSTNFKYYLYDHRVSRWQFTQTI